jgi:hypothetical protein
VLGSETGASYRPHLRVSIGHGPSSSTRDEPPLLGFSHLPLPCHWGLSGFRAMRSPCSLYGIAVVDRLLLGTCRGLTGVGGKRCRCQSDAFRQAEGSDRVSFRVFACSARSTASPRFRVLSWTYAPVQSLSPLRYHPYGLDDPASPFLSADLAVFSCRASPFRDLAFRALLSSGYAVLQSVARTTLARTRIHAAGSSPGLWLPTARAETRVHAHGPFGPLRSAFRVWLPS